MNGLTTILRDNLIKEDLGTLFQEARKYGLVYIHTHKDGTYACNITFNTITHCELKANSGYNHKTPESAVKAALEKAVEIVKTIKEMK